MAIGTVFRHFPTEQALLQALMKDLLHRLTARAETLTAPDADPATGIELQITDAVQPLRHEIEELLARAQHSGTVRRDIRPDEIIALLAGTCQAALHSTWNPDLQHRTLAIIFHGLGP
ncbi:hypothetical protein GCM10010468_22720 [Actinocorallia longicatena]|uniref:Transcriptional regulator SbtR-like C-terminal domain-containing protein n=1 Tax=Actinocorallia longicatena TaxID=111803 RepID=A0ABP6Q9W1_9ACTN